MARQPRSARFEMRLTPDFMDRIDAARGDVQRTTWAEGAMRMRLGMPVPTGIPGPSELRELTEDELMRLHAAIHEILGEDAQDAQDAQDVEQAAPLAAAEPPVAPPAQKKAQNSPGGGERRRDDAPEVEAAPEPDPVPEQPPWPRRPPPRRTGGRKQ